jgi:CRISPR system Cascade subunit CasD
MSTLLLRLVGPMQSWGVASDYKERDTLREPSKSGVIGLLCAALGKPRAEKPDDGFPTLETLASLIMGVRVDWEGERAYDYHTAGKEGFWRASGGVEREDVIVSKRWYLADAAFLIGLGSDSIALLEELHRALENPRWALCLGRKACVPSKPVWLRDGLKSDVELRAALEKFPWLGRRDVHNRPEQLRLVLEDNENGERWVRDVPLCFEHGKRDFTLRRVTFEKCPAPNETLEVP